MATKQFEIWNADLNPRFGTEPGKIRPVIVIQTDLLNVVHPSTIICPLTTNVQLQASLLRVHVKKGIANLNYDSDVLVDQIRSIDNRRFIRRLGKLSPTLISALKQNIRIVLDL